jgi:hypothetical protein
MAGASQRFKNAGYTLPKYMLYVYDKSLFNLVLSSFKSYFENNNFIFIIRNLFSTKHFVDEECKLLGIRNYQIICIDTLTRGQAETVYMGLNQTELSNDDSVLIFNIDTIRKGFLIPSNINDCDGYLEVFKGTGKNWSYAKVIPDTTQVIETSEKREISNNCSTGIYYFKKLNYFYESYDYYNRNNLNINEFYIAPLYNYLIQKKRNIQIDVISRQDVVFCGIPEEYIDFVNTVAGTKSQKSR